MKRVSLIEGEITDKERSVDRFGSKYELLVAPAILLCVSLALTLLSSRFEKTAAAQDGQKSGAAAK